MDKIREECSTYNIVFSIQCNKCLNGRVQLSSVATFFVCMRGSRKFCQRGSNSDNVYFFLMREERIKIALKEGHHRPAGERHLNGVSLAGRRWPNIECWLGSFVISQGIWSSIAKKAFIFVIFSGAGGVGPDPLPPS